MFDRYLKRWILACASGEFIGIVLAVSIAVAVNRWLGEPGTPGEKFHMLLLMLSAGALEGFILGIFQWRILREKFSLMPAWQWIGSTVAVAMLGWLMGMIPVLYFMGQNAQPGVTYEEPALILVIVGALALGMIFGAIFGIVQWLVFQRYAKDSVQWVTGNSLGWGIVMVLIFLAGALPGESTPYWMTVAGSLAGGAIGALSLGVLTGIYLKKIIKGN